MDENDRQILMLLGERTGTTTSWVTERAGLYLNAAPRERWRWIRRRLLSLQHAGLVGVLDDQKPVCWKRTPAGTAALGGEA